MRPSDLVAAISTTEMAILVSTGSAASLDAVVSRVRHSVETRARELAGHAAPRLLIRMGYASLDTVEPKPETLLEAAQSALKPVYSGNTEVRAA